MTDSLSSDKKISDFDFLPQTGEKASDFQLIIDKQTEITYCLVTISKKIISNMVTYKNEMLKRKKIEHVNILRLSFMLEDNDNIYFVLENFEGVSLKKYLEMKKNVPEARLFRIYLQIWMVVEVFHDLKLQMKDLSVKFKII